MIAYNRTLLDNLLIKKVAKTWFANGLLSTEQMAVVLRKYDTKHFKPNVFIKIGLFIFTLFLISAAMGLFSLMFAMALMNGGSFETYGIIISLIFGAACIFFLEKFIQWRNWYSNGIDDGLLYSGLSFIFSVIAFALSNSWDNENTFLLMCFLFLPFLVVAAIRYLDRVVTLAAVVCIYIIYFLIIIKMGDVAKFIMPFAFMALSVGIYFVTRILLHNQKALHYKGCLKVVKTVSLIVFYISGNYFVIRESSSEFFNLHLEPGQDIPMAFVFYIFTALVPLAYLFFGLKKKDKLMVWVALLLIAVSVLTFKYYFSTGHPEITLTLAGLVMIALAYTSIKYLVTDKHGITFKDDPNEENFLKSNAEALVIAQSFGTTQVQQTEAGVKMGGGSFGGGGSGNKF